MAEIRVLDAAALPRGEKKAVKIGETEILLLHLEDSLVAVQAKCPHAGAPLEQGAVCNGSLVCPWHMGTFALPGGELLEPPAMESLKTYAVRVEGDGIYVDPEPLPAAAVPAPANVASQHGILLIGAGAAGAMAATTLRQQGFTGRILAVDPVADEPVDRTQLSKQVLSGKMPLTKTSISSFAQLNVERLHAALVTLSAEKSTANLSDGQTIKFDSALLATGGTPKRLDIPGKSLAHTIRHTDDVRRILAAAEGKQQAVIIGTSFIGLEAASALIQRGMQVTVVGKEALPFAEKFGDEAAHALIHLHESKGTRFQLDVETVSLSDAGVTVREGVIERLIPADLIVMGVGVEPELNFEHDLPPAPEGGGILVDATLRAAGNVWIAGDIANVDGTRIEHWRLAEQHGQHAARAMLGQEGSYEGVPFFWTSHFGKRFGYLGHAKEWDEIVTDGDPEGLDFMSFYVKGGQIKAVLSCGRDSHTALLAELMRDELSVQAGRKAVAEA